MNKHFLYSDSDFITRLRTCTLPPDFFSHEAHLRLAWIYLKKSSADDAIKHVCEDLFRFVNFLGASDKYHLTLTVAAVKIIAVYKNISSSETFSGFINEFPQLGKNFKGILLTYYSHEILYSDKARKSFVEPDLAAFF